MLNGLNPWLQKENSTKPNKCWKSMTFWCGSGSADPYLWLMSNGSGSGSNFFHISSAQHLYEKRERSWSGSIPLTNGSATGRPKNMRILPIRIPTQNQTVKLKWTRSRQCGWHVTQHRYRYLNFFFFRETARCRHRFVWNFSALSGGTDLYMTRHRSGNSKWTGSLSRYINSTCFRQI